jgi:hypothetical protein
MTIKTFKLLVVLLLVQSTLYAQQQRWQQRISYDMDIDVDVEKHQFTGKQTVVYQNNSNEALDKVFYHLYFNAFQPNSMMDVRSRTIQDPDQRVADRILKLKNDERGYHKILKMQQDGKEVTFKVEETILEVKLNTPIPAGGKTTLYMEFESQVPLQVRRSGWMSAEGVEFSMSQWYPKVSEYDYQGWHSNPYVGREFHGVWGDFDVKINIDKEYTLGGTGIVQNPKEVGHGYEPVGTKVDYGDKKKIKWHFKAENVHDFMWAADPDYIHDTQEVGKDGLVLHFLYQDDENIKDVWKKSQKKMVQAFGFVQQRYGKYPYKQYSFIQGGDGGMEYPMGTLITGKRNFGSLVGVMVHELMHTWYQMILATNESLYPWMDEGFTSYSSSIVMAHLFNNQGGNPHDGSYRGYNYLAKSGVEEPMTTHADHYNTNFAYGQASYSKGAVFLGQLNYIVGEGVFDNIMLKYYNEWAFKHPNPNDFIRIAEKESGLELDWYKEHFVHTTNTIDYSIVDVVKSKKGSKDTTVTKSKELSYSVTGGDMNKRGTTIYIEKKGRMPMPLEVVVTYKDGKKTKLQNYYIPTVLMRGEKKDEMIYGSRTVMPDWPWTHPVYELHLPVDVKKIEKVEIDPSLRLADIDRENNVWEAK